MEDDKESEDDAENDDKEEAAEIFNPQRGDYSFYTEFMETEQRIHAIMEGEMSAWRGVGGGGLLKETDRPCHQPTFRFIGLHLGLEPESLRFPVQTPAD